MGLLDKVVKEEIAKKEQKTREEMGKLSSEVLRIKQEKEIAGSARPFVIQGLKEFPCAMEQIGAEPLPLVVVKNPTFFSEDRPTKCMWGYYLYPRFASYALFMTSEGKYYTGVTTFSSDRKVTDKNKTRVDFRLPNVKKPFGRYMVEPNRILEEEISEDEAASLIVEDLLHHRRTPEKTEYDNIRYVRLTEALDKDDLETAVAELFSLYIGINKKIWLKYRGEQMDFLRSLNRK